jgi:hypothetical protein
LYLKPETLWEHWNGTQESRRTKRDRERQKEREREGTKLDHGIRNEM